MLYASDVIVIVIKYSVAIKCYKKCIKNIYKNKILLLRCDIHPSMAPHAFSSFNEPSCVVFDLSYFTGGGLVWLSKSKDDRVPSGVKQHIMRRVRLSFCIIVSTMSLLA